MPDRLQITRRQRQCKVPNGAHHRGSILCSGRSGRYRRRWDAPDMLCPIDTAR